jgi:acetyl-CoA carboxylase biotin carboxylase subunit
MIRSLLIANRGEIAVRIARTCREMGIRTVLATSAADQDSTAAQIADATVCVGPADARRSYLDIAAVVEAACGAGAEAVHPGYGFLSENPDFAEVCVDNGLIFVGPEPDVLAELGDKVAARTRMAEAGLPVLPGSPEAIGTAEEAVEVAESIGFPVIIKAVAGGGGRGMTVVDHPAGFRRAYTETRAHAQAVFGDGRVYVERYLPQARHVEVQVLCDAHGTGVHLGERDCSVQRRNQKLIEETPAPGLPADLTEAICAAALDGAKAIGFTGAGTFEFLVTEDGHFWFMEANARIQVEHPVTEMTTGVDLIREQLNVAGGGRLPFSQADIAPRGASVECRVNAEDPDRGFAPASGVLAEFAAPGGPFVRVDTHAYPGMFLSPYYDSLLAKVIVWAPDRSGALDRMDRALGEFRLGGRGIRTTIPFLREVIAHPEFRSGEHTTAFVAGLLRDRDRSKASS